MKIDIIKIGNSKGIRIPKPVLESCAINDAVELEVVEGKLVLSAVTQPRAGWEAAFAAEPETAKDTVLGDGLTNDFDSDEWHW